MIRYIVVVPRVIILCMGYEVCIRILLNVVYSKWGSVNDVCNVVSFISRTISFRIVTSTYRVFCTVLCSSSP